MLKESLRIICSNPKHFVNSNKLRKDPGRLTDLLCTPSTPCLVIEQYLARIEGLTLKLIRSFVDDFVTRKEWTELPVSKDDDDKDDGNNR